MLTRENALIVFARAVRPGHVKTRLMPVFSAEEACEIHTALTGDVIERVAEALSDAASVSVSWSEPGENAAAISPLPPGVSEEVQQGGDLGERMALAFQSKLREGFRRVVILGSDVPTLPPDHLTGAFQALDKAEVVLGPTADGGYYLVGMSRLHLEIFLNVRWGTKDVLAVTKKRLKQKKASFVVLGPWHDVDTPEDVGRLWKELLHMKERRLGGIPQRTYRLLARLVPGRIPV